MHVAGKKRRSRSRRRSSGGGQRSFCPAIRVKCSRKFARSQPDYAPAGSRLRSKLAKYKKWKARAMKSLRGFGNVHPNAEMTSLPASTVKAVAAKIAHAAANEARCTVSMGGKSWKLKGAAAGKKVAELIRQQRAGGCCSPKVVR